MNEQDRPPGPLVLVVDDDTVARGTARGALESQGYRVEEAEDGLLAFERFGELEPDIVLLDVRMPGMDGFEVCSKLRSLPSGRHVPILIMIGLDDLAAIEEAYRAGATDFEVKPVRWMVTLHRIGYMLQAAKAAEEESRRRDRDRRRLRAEVKELRQALQQAKLTYRSSEMESVVAVARRVAPTDATVLIIGESGTGKELLARTLHELSPRKGKARVVVDCGSIPTSLIESELFGHVKGAFTGATTARVGRLVEADSGTVLLDEIGELPLEVQSKLLRFVQERQVVPVGGTRPRTVDTRIIAATNRDLAAEVGAGRFREDLYYRLNVINLRLPPLRERPDDVLHLARHFLEVFAFQYHRDVRSLSSAAESLLLEHPWPGNVRELQNRILQAVILSEGESLQPDALRLDELSELDRPAQARPASRDRAPSSSREAERRPRDELPDAVPADTVTSRADGAQAQLAHLLDSLANELRQTLRKLDREDMAPPTAQWLTDDLLSLAAAATGQVRRQAASLVGVAETTFRRRIRRIESSTDLPTWRPGSWTGVEGLLQQLLEANRELRAPLTHLAETTLLEQILELYPGDTKRGASLFGVSVPTFRRRVKALGSSEARSRAT